jgi:hypothetical protein
MRVLDRRGLPLFFQQAAGAALASGVAVLLAWDVDVRSSLVLAAGIVVETDTRAGSPLSSRPRPWGWHSLPASRWASTSADR